MREFLRVIVAELAAHPPRVIGLMVLGALLVVALILQNPYWAVALAAYPVTALTGAAASWLLAGVLLRRDARRANRRP